jgi:hypothetical protein
MMGYRSYGAMWFSQQALDAISKEQNEMIQRDIENGSFTYVHSDADIYNDKTDAHGVINGLMLEFHEWKWYSSYKDIQTYEAIFKMLEEKKIDYDFVRLGEENTDNELHTQKRFLLSRDYEVI